MKLVVSQQIIKRESAPVDAATGSSLVKDGSHLFEAIHLEAIGFVHEDQSGRV